MISRMESLTVDGAMPSGNPSGGAELFELGVVAPLRNVGHGNFPTYSNWQTQTRMAQSREWPSGDTHFCFWLWLPFSRRIRWLTAGRQSRSGFIATYSAKGWPKSAKSRFWWLSSGLKSLKRFCSGSPDFSNWTFKIRDALTSCRYLTRVNNSN